MSTVYKFLGTQVALSSANNVGGSGLVRVINNNSAVGVLTVAYANGTTYANTTLAAYETMIVEKGKTDSLAGTNLLATPVAYRN